MKLGGGGCATVVVAVKRAEGRGSQRAVRWAVQNLMTNADYLLLVHVMPTVTSVPTPTGGCVPITEMDASLAEMYINDMKVKCEENFMKFKFKYHNQKGNIYIKSFQIFGRPMCYIRHCPELLWEEKGVIPVTKQTLQHKMLTPNHVLLSAIQEWIIRNITNFLRPDHYRATHIKEVHYSYIANVSFCELMKHLRNVYSVCTAYGIRL